MEFTTQQVLDIQRDTPLGQYGCNAADFLLECQETGEGVMCVHKEVFVAAVLWHAPKNNCTPLDMLTMMEDHNHAFVYEQHYWINHNYLLSPSE